MKWFVSSLGAIFAGYVDSKYNIVDTLLLNRGRSAGIYTKCSLDDCHYILSNSNANVVVVEDEDQLQKIFEVWHRAKYVFNTCVLCAWLNFNYPIYSIHNISSFFGEGAHGAYT